MNLFEALIETDSKEFDKMLHSLLDEIIDDNEAGKCLDSCEADEYVEIDYFDELVERVKFNNPATIVFWKDGTKTVVKAQESDIYDPEKGIALCFMKKVCGNTGRFNDVLKEHLNEYYKEEKENDVD